jgi:hypothetical protein
LMLMCLDAVLADSVILDFAISNASMLMMLFYILECQSAVMLKLLF